MLTWQPGASLHPGALFILAACVCWGLDNSLTAQLQHFVPEHVVALKGLIEGSANLTFGLAVAGWGSTARPSDFAAALTVGATGYGLSITLWVKGARELGAARGQVIFATAPFVGVTTPCSTLTSTLTTTCTTGTSTEHVSASRPAP